MDKITITKSTGFLDRIKQSFKNILGGFILIVVAIVALFRNEGSSLQTAKGLSEVRQNVISVSSEKVDDLNDSKLIYTQGKMTTNETLEDEEFGISKQENIIKLARTVEMYQWNEESQTETKEKFGGSQEETTTYTYKKIWSNSIIDSSNFQEPNGHKNPELIFIEPKTQYIKNAKIGAFELNFDQIQKMNWLQDFEYNKSYTNNINNSSYRNFSAVANNKLYIRQNGYVNPSSPEIGDIRITWQIVPIDQISVIAEQSGEGFRPHQTKAGSLISMVSRGNLSADAMITNAEKANSFKTWVIRFIGIILIIVGFNMLLSILGTIASVVPFLGWITTTGTGIVSFFLGLSLGIVVIALSWLRFRPIIGIILLLVAVGLLFGLKFYKKKKDEEKEIKK